MPSTQIGSNSVGDSTLFLNMEELKDRLLQLPPAPQESGALSR